jgi:predicted aspartyl protease
MALFLLWSLQVDDDRTFAVAFNLNARPLKLHTMASSKIHRAPLRFFRLIEPAKASLKSDKNDQLPENEDQASTSNKIYLSRRHALSLFGTGSSLLHPATLSKPAPAVAAAAIAADAPSKTALPIADLPMKRLKLPRGALGRDYIIIPLKVNGRGPFDFMVDSGLTTELITPHLQSSLGIGANKKRRPVTGIAAGGGNVGSLVELENASLCCGKFANGKNSKADEYPLPKLYAVVTDFPQEHIDPAHDPVEGMVGMEVLEMFDVDFANHRLKLWEHGQADVRGMVEIPAAVLNESGLLGIRVVSGESSRSGQQPMIGVLDCGASFSSVNTAGARLLGVSPDPADHRDTPIVTALGVDGRPMNLATAKIALSFVGDSSSSSIPQQGQGVAFEQPPSQWKPWDPTLIGVGDLNVFSDLLGDGRTPFKGPATLIGLDVLSQRRFILSTSGPGRARKLYVAPS